MEMKRTTYSFLHRLSCAWNGIQLATRQERHFRIHLSVMVTVLIAGWMTGIARWEWVALLGISALVMALELVNTALEKALDRIHPDRHDLIGQAKDMAAGAVLIAAMVSVIIGMLIFLPKWFC